MDNLENWLRQATRHLAKDSVAKVRTEIEQHYESARDAALAEGVDADKACKLALDALGDANAANSQYRRVLLTSAEARTLREGNCEMIAVCSRPWLKRMALAAPVAAIAAAAALFFTGQVAAGRDVLILGIGMGSLFAAPFLPIYTPSRSRLFRFLKWGAMSGALLLLFGSEALKWSWLLISFLWPLAWIEWTRASIRRKLPLAQWPKHLYL
jgi:hypothetical protein